MAKLIKGISGPISGKVGNMIFFIRNDKCFVKTISKPRTKPPTIRQAEQRSKFGMVMSFVKLFKPFLNLTYKTGKPGLTPMNTLVKHILNEAVVGDYPNQKIDYCRVNLTKGNLGPLRSVEFGIGAAKQLHLKWPVETNSFNAFFADELFVLLYCEAIQEFWFDPQPGIRRGDGCCSLTLPAAFTGKEMQIWLTLRSANGLTFSNSLYVGATGKKSKKRS